MFCFFPLRGGVLFFALPGGVCFAEWACGPAIFKGKVFFVGGFCFFPLRGGSGGSLCSPDSASLRPASGEGFFRF